MTKTDQGKRLGGLLRYRRMELDPAWRDRETFAAQHHLSVRVVNDLENGNRGNFTAGTVAGFEVAYKLTPGSLRRTLAGGDLEPAPEPRQERPGRFRLIPGDDGQMQVKGVNVRALQLVAGVLGPDTTELRNAIEAAGPGATGDDIFDDATLAGIWNLVIEGACSETYALTLMSVYLLRRRASAEAETAHRAG